MPITVSIVEHPPDTRDSLAERLSRSPKLRCLNAYASGEAALRGIPADNPDVALVELHLPGIGGIECVARLKERLPNLPVLMISNCEENETIFDSLRAGAAGFLLRNAPSEELIQAIEQLHAGGAPLSLRASRTIVEYFHDFQNDSPPAPPRVATLSHREEEVLALLAKGYQYKQVSEQLQISLNTVRTYIHRIFEKLQVQSRTEAIIKFLGRN